MKKRSIILGALALVLVVSLSVGGTLAYMTAQTEAKYNEFTVGNVGIELEEPNWSPNSKLIPATTIKKDPTVTVLANSEDCYVRVKVFIPTAFEPIIEEAPVANTGWTRSELATQPQGGKVYYYNYNVKVLSPDNDLGLAPAFLGIKVNNVGNTALATFNSAAADQKKITVEAQAIQAASFANATKAWEAFDVQHP